MIDTLTDELEVEPETALDERERFNEEKAHVIGSTDSPSVLLLSKYGTPLSVYRRLVNEPAVQRPSLPAWLGARIENVVAELGMYATGLKFRSDNLHHLHPTYPFIGCHLDRRVVGQPNVIVELKTRSRRTGWGEDGSALIPPDIWCQVQHQMAVTGCTKTLVVTLFGLGHGLAVYPIERDEEFITELLNKLVEFWETYVVPGVPPPPSGKPTDTEIIQDTPGGSSGVLRPATPEQEALVRRLRLAILNFAQAEESLQQYKNRIKQLIGPDADGLTGSFGTIYWKRTRDIHKTGWERLAGAYRAAAEEALDLALHPGTDSGQAADRAEHVQLVLLTAEDLFTRTEPGIRRWRAEFTQGEPDGET